MVKSTFSKKFSMIGQIHCRTLTTKPRKYNNNNNNNKPCDHRRNTSKRIFGPQRISRISFSSCSSFDADVLELSAILISLSLFPSCLLFAWRFSTLHNALAIKRNLLLTFFALEQYILCVRLSAVCLSISRTIVEIIYTHTAQCYCSRTTVQFSDIA